MKYLLLYLLLGIRVFSVEAQNLVVNLANASIETFAISDIKSIKFSSQAMILQEWSGTINTWDINDIDNYTFDGLAITQENITITTEALNVFPNPTNNKVNINYYSDSAGKISIAVYDVNGRMIEQLFNGEHDLSTEVTWGAKEHSSNQAGKYFIKITTANKAISKSVIIQ